MTHVASPVRRRRLLLVLTSALGGFAATSTTAQTAPVIPTNADVVKTQPNGLLTGPVVTNPGGNLNVELRANNSVIDWNGFNIPENRTANFSKGLVLGNVAVLNRDVSGNVSQLLGKLTSDPSVAVWVYNPNGIIVGAKAAFNTGSLVLSTLDVDNDDFLDGGRSYKLSSGTSGAGSTSGITVLNGAQIKVQGGNRGLVMVAPKIDANGTFEAVDQDVAFVTATDVTLTYTSNSPLSVTLNRGTAVSGNSQYIRGTVAGKDALFALASQATVTDALLQIDAGVTTASNGTRGIVLSAGKPTTGVTGVTVAGATADTGGIASVLATGALNVVDRGGSDLLSVATGAATFTGALASGRDIVLNVGGPLSVGGAATAGRDYELVGAGVALGGLGPAVQQAVRDVRVEATNGNITGGAKLTLQSGGSAGLTLVTGGTAAGNILFDTTSSLVGGSDRQGYVDLKIRSADNQIALGNVAARSLRQAIGNGGTTAGLVVTGPLTLGDINVRDPLALQADGVTAGTLASDRGVSIASNGALATGAITAGNGSVLLTGSGATTITGAIGAAGSNADITITRDGAAALQGLTATRDVRIDAASGTAAVAGGVTAGRDYLVAGSGVTLGGAVNSGGVPQAVTQRADGVVGITAGAGGITGLQGLTLRSDTDGSGGNAVTLTVTAPSTTGIAFANGTSVFGGPARQSDVVVRLNDAASPIAFDRVEARNLTGLTTTGPLRLGTVSIVNDLSARGGTIDAGALTSSSGAVTLVANAGALNTGAVTASRAITMTGSELISTGALASGDAVTLDGVGAVTLAGNVQANGAIALRGASLGFAGGSVRSGGAIDLLARSGGIASTAALALTSSSSQSTDFVRLQANGVQGIQFAPGSAITAGANRALRVAVFNGNASAPLSLGDVSARSLSALAAADGDATRLGGAIVSNNPLTFGALDLVDSFAAESLGGDLTVGRIAVTGTGQGISLRAANGALSVQSDLSASGDVVLASGTALRLNAVESRDGRATLSSGGALTLASLAGKLEVDASGTQVTVDTVRGGAVSLVASAGDIQAGGISGAAVTARANGGAVTVRNALAATGIVGLTATGDVRIGGAVTGTDVTAQAGGDAALTGGLQASGNVALTGRSIALGGAQSARGRFTAASTAGGITGAAGTSIIADSDGQGAEPLSLTATGGAIALDPAGFLRGGNGTSTVALATDGAGITVGRVTATTFTATGASVIRTGDLSLADALTLRAADGVSTGAINAGNGSVTIDGANSAVSTEAITAGGAVALTGGSLSFGRVQAANLTGAAAAGSLSGQDVVVDGAASLQASGTLQIGALTAGDAATLAGSTLRFGNIDAAALTASSTGTLNGGNILARGAVGLRGAAVTAGQIAAASLTAAASNGALVAGDVTVGDSATIDATMGTVGLGTVTATRGNVAITASGPLTATGVSAGGTALLKTTGPDADILLTNGLTADGSVTVAATGNVRSPTIRSRTSDLTVAAPNGELTGFTPGSGVTLGAGPGKAFSLTIGTAARLGDVIGGQLTIVASSISAGRVDTGTQALELRATNGDLTLTGPATGGTVTLGASGQTKLANVTASGGLTLTGSGIGFGSIAGATIDATSAGVVTGGDVAAIGTASLLGGTVNLGRVTAGTGLTIAANNGDLTLTGLAKGDTVKLGASRQTKLADVTASGALTLTGGSIGFGTIAGATIDARTAGVMSGGDVAATGTASLLGGTVNLGRVAAGTGLTIAANSNDLTITGLATGGTVTLGARGQTKLADVTASGGLTLTGGSIGFGTIAGATIDATTAGVVTGGDVAATGTANLLGGTVNLGRVTAGTGLTIAANNGDLTITGSATGGMVTLGARGQTKLASVTAGKGLTLTGGSIGFTDLAGATIDVTSVGAIGGMSAAATGALSLRGGSVNLGQVSAGTALTVAATGGDLTLTGLANGGTVTLGATGRTTLANVSAGDALTLTGGSIGFGDITGRSIDATSNGGVTGRSAAATGALNLRGATVTLGSVSATTALTMMATAGDLTLSAPVTAGAVTLGASGRLGLTSATTSGALALNGGSIGFNDIAGGSIDATSAGSIVGTSARSGGNLGLRGGSIGLTQAVASAGITLAATAGDLGLNSLTSGGDALVTATGAARIAGTVTSGGAYRVTGGTVTLGGDGVLQKANGDIRITTTSGDLTGARGMTLASDADGVGGDRLVLDAVGTLGLGGTRLQAGSGALGLRAGTGRAIQLGSVAASRIGSFDGNDVAGGFTHDAGFAADDVTVTSLSAALTRGDLVIGRLVAVGDLGLRTDAGAITLGETAGGNIDVASSGALTTGALTSTGATTLKGDRIDVSGRLAAARQLLAEARAALTVRDVVSSGAVMLTAGGTLAGGSVEGAGITASGAGVTLSGAKAGDALTLTSRGDLSIGSSTAGGAAKLDSAGLATIGGLAAGPSVAVTANDVAVNGSLRAQTVAFTNRAPTTATLRIGDGTGADGFRLSDAEVRQVTADTLRFDAGSGAMEVGTIALATGSGRAVEMLGTGDIRVIGAVSTQGTGRSVRIGGGQDSGNANAIHVVATSGAGGRLLFDGSDVELRGNRIAVGLAPGFIDTLQPGAAGLAQAQTLIGSGNSALYNPQLGGGFYDPTATTTLSARSLSVRFGDYALFQNTAIPGEFSGLRIGGTPAAPITPALRISSFGSPAQASVALFGTINGIDGAGAALLGAPVISIDPVLLPNSRINGCLAGSGAGCITTIVIQPTLQVFDWNSEEVFGIARDVSVPFSPVIGGNNEELLTDLPALAPQSPADTKGAF